MRIQTDRSLAHVQYWFLCTVSTLHTLLSHDLACWMAAGCLSSTVVWEKKKDTGSIFLHVSNILLAHSLTGFMFALRTLSYRHRIKGISCSTQPAGNINTTDFYYSQATNSRANRSFQLTMTIECTLTFIPQPTEAATDSNSSNNKCVIISHTSACLCDWWTLISWKHCYSQQ